MSIVAISLILGLKCDRLHSTGVGVGFVNIGETRFTHSRLHQNSKVKLEQIQYRFCALSSQ
ncbi:MAG: hypothetical protein ACR2LR_27465 [Hassallia sp.]